MNKPILAVISGSAFLAMLLQSQLAVGQDDDPIYPDDASVESERCVSLTAVRSTEVLDDRNVIFHMRGKSIYRNVLPRRCPGLSRDEAFSYQTSMNRLCSSDTITVLSGLGVGSFPGATCALGKFYAMSEAELEALKNEAEMVEELGLE